MTYRANQLQAKVFAGDLELNRYIDVYAEDYWHAKLTYDVLDSVDIKDLKYIKEDWKTQKIGDDFWSVQGQTPNYSYFTQKQRYQAIHDHVWYQDKRAREDPIGWAADEYKEWEEMHDPNAVMWYDTAACWNTGRILENGVTEISRIQKSYGSMYFGAG